MLPKYYRFRVLWTADQTLTYNDGARVGLRIHQWKLSSGVLGYSSTVTDDFGFGAGDTIVTGGEAEATAIDNTSNLYWGLFGYLHVTANVSSTDGNMKLFVEFCDDNSTWPSDLADFSIGDLIQVATLTMSTDAVDEDRAVNFTLGTYF